MSTPHSKSKCKKKLIEINKFPLNALIQFCDMIELKNAIEPTTYFIQTIQYKTKINKQIIHLNAIHKKNAKEKKRKQ